MQKRLNWIQILENDNSSSNSIWTDSTNTSALYYECNSLLATHVRTLQHGKVKQYFRDKLEANKKLVDCLRSKQLIDDDERTKILQGSGSKKANTCYEILVQNVTDDNIPILNTILRENGLKTVEEMMEDEISESGSMCLSRIVVECFFILL